MSEYDYPARVRVGRASAGLGLFAEEPIAKEVFVIEYTGEKITDKEADRRGGKYLFTLTDTQVIDGKGRENTARYMNHACRPNCEAEIDEDEGRIIIRAKRAIKKGEELTYHYGREYIRDHILPTGCKCAGCRLKAADKCG